MLPFSGDCSALAPHKVTVVRRAALAVRPALTKRRSYRRRTDSGIATTQDWPPRNPGRFTSVLLYTNSTRGSSVGRSSARECRYAVRMPGWMVPVTLVHSDDYDPLPPAEVWELATSLPGGGSGSSGGQGYEIGPRKFTQTVDVKATDEKEAALAAKSLMTDAIDEDRFPGWSISNVGQPKVADE